MEKIKLIIPGKADYVSTVRLTAASICNNIDFDFEVVEDIRVAISEACNMLIDNEQIEVEFQISELGLKILVSLPDSKIEYKKDIASELGRQILSSLVDKVEYKEDYISMFKGID